MTETPLACNLAAIPPDKRDQHGALATEIFSSALEHRELADGYAFHLPGHLLPQVAEWMPLEQLCCSFFDFRVELRHTGELWLSLTGREGVKELVRVEMDLENHS